MGRDLNSVKNKFNFNKVITLDCDDLNQFENGVAFFKKDKKVGIINVGYT